MSQLESGVGGDVPLFCDVAATHSEILLVTESSRALYCWPCGSGKNGDTPPVSPHPLAYELKLSHGGIRLIKSSHIRTTVVMDSGDIATFYDPLLRGRFVMYVRTHLSMWYIAWATSKDNSYLTNITLKCE